MKYITYNEVSRVFVLQTKNSMYQMKVDKYDVLLHLYYGDKIGDTETDYRVIGFDRGFSGNPYIAGMDRTYSLDVLPQEYSASGNGDYRINTLEAVNADGTTAAFLQYKSYTMQKGKYSLKGLPAIYANEEEAETLIITLEDRVSGLQVRLMYGVLYENDIITRAVEIINSGEEPIVLKRAMSVQVDYPNSGDMDMIHFHGRHTMERQVERHTIYHGIQSFESKRGASSHQQNPFVILCDTDATEKSGNCYGYSFVYSGNHCCQAEMDQYNQTRIVVGIHPYQFQFKLEKGDTFTAPEVVMAYSGEGLGKLSRLYHDVYRDHLIRSKYVKAPRPILVNNWEATYFKFDEEKLFQIAKKAKEIGLDMLVMDDGWFGKREDDNTGLGDWVVNEQKLKGGLPKLVERINGIGMKFGIWLEPEMVSEDSDLYREHPEWCLKIPGRLPVRSRNQLNLDVSRKEVRDYIMNQIFKVLDSCKIDYVKWDFNRSLENIYSAALSSERQGEVLHNYVLGVYDMMEQLVSRYPDLLFENCSGGGGRFDAGMLYYSPQIWCSDNTDAIDRLKIQYGTSFGYPISSMGSHVSVCPNHQTGRITPFATRGTVAKSGTFGYELDLVKMSEEDLKLAAEQIRQYKEVEHLVLTGDYYRLTDPYKNQVYVAWQFVSKDKNESFTGCVQLHTEPNPRVYILKLDGLAPEKRYKDTKTGKIYTGAALMKAGIPIPATQGDYIAMEFHFKSVE